MGEVRPELTSAPCTLLSSATRGLIPRPEHCPPEKPTLFSGRLHYPPIRLLSLLQSLNQVPPTEWLRTPHMGLFTFLEARSPTPVSQGWSQGVGRAGSEGKPPSSTPPASSGCHIPRLWRLHSHLCPPGHTPSS